MPDRPILPNGQSNLPGASKGRPFPISYASLIAGTGGFDPDDINNVDPSTGLPLRFVIDSIISGSLIINNFPAQVGQLFGPNDSMIWNAPSAFVGSQAAFSVRLWDGNDQQTAGLYSANGTIVNVTTQNDRPTLTSVVPIGGVTEDVPFTLSFATLANAANEADINADPITFRVESILAGSLSLNGQPVAPGTVFAAGQNLVWNPPVDANGTIVAFTISAFDGELLSTPPVNVPFVVSAVNDAPRFSQGIVLPNGIIGNSYNLTYDLIRQATGAFDVDSPILTFTISTINTGELRRNGVAIGAGAVIAPTDQLVYIPPVNVPGIIGAFTINVSDGSLSSGPATVNIQNTLARFYRSYNPNAGYHFFTTSRDEFQIAVRNGLRDETTNTPGMAVFTAPASGLNAIHRLRNPNTGRHYYTASDGERDGLVTKGWIFERDEGYVGTQAVNGMSPIYRLYNSNTGTHLYVDNQGTRDSIIAQYKGIWQDHGILGYAVVVPGSTILSPVAGSGTTNPTSPTGPSERRLLPPSTASSLPPTPAALSVADQGLVATSNGISSTVSNDTGSTFTTGNAGSGSSRASTPAAPSVDQYWAELSQNLLKSHGVDLGTALLPLQ